MRWWCVRACGGDTVLPGERLPRGCSGFWRRAWSVGAKRFAAGDVSRTRHRTRWRREIVLHRNTSTGTRFGAPRTGKSSSSLVNRRRSLTRRRLPLLVLPASVLTGNEEGSLPSCWGLSMCHRRAQRASQIARTASGRYLSTGFCHERPFLLVKSHQPDST